MSYRPKPRDEIRRNMSAIRSSGNKTEVRLRKELHRRGFRYRLYSPSLPGKPDFVFPAAKIAVFVDGDFWHGRVLREAGPDRVIDRIKTQNLAYWLGKFTRNIERDEEVTVALEELGWTVIRLWESEVRPDVTAAADLIECEIRKARRTLAAVSA